MIRETIFQPLLSEAEPLICAMLEPNSSNSHDQLSDQTPKRKPINQGPKNRSKKRNGFPPKSPKTPELNPRNPETKARAVENKTADHIWDGAEI